MKKCKLVKLILVASMCFVANFAVSAAVPSITSFTPTSGIVGSTVTITGANFNTTAANNVVFFGATKATVTAATVTSLTVTVPTGATYAPISVSDITTGLTAYSVKPFNVTSKGGGLFDTPVDYTAGTAPFSVAIGDIDGDGKADVVVPNYNASTVSVLRNTSSSGAVSFATKVDYITGTTPFRVAIGDVDGDGKLDLVVSNYGSSSISVFRNTSSVGSLSFDTKVDYTITSSLRGLAIGDLDADGKPDIAVTTNNNSRVFIIKNQSTIGNVSFDSGIDFGTGLSPSDVAIDDIDGDGKPDLIVANQGGSSVSVLRNSSSVVGTIAFDSKVDFAGGSNPFLLGVGDMDGDGKQDLVVANGGDLTASVFRNISVVGTVAFDSYVNFTAGTGNQGVAVGDLDGDEKLDFTTASANLKGVSTFQNTGVAGTVNFATKVDYIQNTISGVAPQSRSVAIGDLDGDGKADLAVANYGTGTVSVMRNIAPPPTISSFTPTSAGSGAVVTITGTNLSYATAVSFGGTAATSFTVVSSTSITATVGAGVSGSVSVTTSGGTATLAGFTWVPAPTITSFTPTSVPLGTVVTITGTNFTGATAVSFGGTAATSFTVVSSTSITATVGAGASGSASVTTSGGTATLAGFTWVPAPTITSFTPTSGPLGTVVTITGTNFTGATTVSFGGTAATSFTVVSSTSITATVGAGASGSVSVTTSGGTATLAGFTWVPAPTITSFTPTSGPFATVVTITGTNFTGATAVSFGGTAATSFTVLSSTSITATVGAGASGNVSISTTGGTVTKAGFIWAAPPTITSFTPTNGPVGTTVTITGTNFNTTAANNVVFFGATMATVNTATSTSLSVQVPMGTTYRYISVSDITTGLTAYSAKPFIVTYTGGAIGASTYATKTDITTGTNPNLVAIGDIDGDGKPDLAVANYGSATVSVYRNTSSSGALSFAPKVDVSTGTSPNSVAIGDVDGDGKPDLAVANTSSNTISVFRNTGSSGIVSFALKVDFTTGTAPRFVSIIDIDSDGKPDLLATNYNSASVSVFRNTSSIGTVSFSAKVDFTTGTSPYSVAVGDVDGDGKPDLAVANTTSNTISVFRNTGSIGTVSFASKVDFTTGTGPYTVAMGDIDGDGKLDLAVATANATAVSVFRNTSSIGTVSFATKVDFTTGSFPWSVAIGDIDGDGKPDLAVTNANDNTVSVFRNTGSSGTISFATKIDFATGTAPRSVVIGDIDGDNMPDLAVANLSSNTVSVLHYSPAPTISSFTPTSGGNSTAVTITGTNFTGATAVSFGGAAATSFTVLSPTSITAVVAAGASGNVSVTTSHGTATLSGFTWVAAPSGLNYTSPNVFTKINVAITPLTPTTSGGNPVASYSVSPALPAGLSLNTATGIISGIPTAITPEGTYTVTATNSGGSTTKAVVITVNDIPPAQLSYANPNTFTKGIAIPLLAPEVYGGEVVSFTVSPALPSGLSLNSTSGDITGTPTAITPVAIYTVTATNSGGSTTYDVTITVNDLSPSNLSYISPNIFIKDAAITALAPVVNGGPVLSYSVSPDLPIGLSLNTNTGEISGTPTVITPTAIYTVTATNSGGSTTHDVSITVNDIAPNNLSYTGPNIFTKDGAITSLTPTVSGGPVVNYSVSPALPVGLSLNTTSGEISGTPTAVAPATTYTVTATNSGGAITYDVNITVNDVAPVISYTSSNVYTKGMVIPNLSPTVSGGLVVSYSVSPALPAGLSLNALTGEISGTPTAITPPATYTVTAVNSGGTSTYDVSITVNDVAPVINYTSSNVYTKGMVIPNLNPTVSGGLVVSYSVSSALPDGLNLNTLTGEISGTPTAITPLATYTVTAVNSGGTSTYDVNITVNDVAPVISYANSNVYTKGIVIPNLIPTVSGGLVVSYSVSPALPAGLSLNTLTGEISGTSTAITPLASYTVTAVNSGGTSTYDVNITVNDVAPAGLSYTTPNLFMKGMAISSLQPTISGNVVTYSVNPTLPTGLVLDALTGIISGTPTVRFATANYTVRAVNSGGEVSFTIQITVPDIAGDLNGDGKIVLPELAGDKDGDGTIDHGEIAGDLDGDGKITSPEIAGDKDGDGKIDNGEIAGDLNGDGKIVLPELAGDKDGDGIIDHGEIAGDLNGDGKIVLPELAGDKDGDGIIDHGEIAGDLNGDGKIVLPELAGDKDGDGIIDHGEIAGDLNGDGKIVLPELAGDKDGDGIIDNGETAGDLNGDGKIVLPELAGDKDGDGIIDHGEIVGDLNGDGKIVSPELAGDKDGDGIIDHGETAGDLNGDGVISSPEILGDLNGDSKIDNSEIAGDANGDGKIGSGEVDATPILVSTLTPSGSPVIGCENSSLDLPYSLMTGAPTQYKLTFDALTLAAGVQNVPYTDLPASGSALALTIPDGIADGIYHGTLQLRNSVQESVAYPFEFNVNVSSRYIVKKFDDVILIDNSSNRFVAYQWYKDGFAVQGATKQFYFDPNGLSGSYSVELTTTDGHKVSSCTKSFTGSKQVRVTAYPNPVSIQQDLTVRVSGLESSSLDNASLIIFNISGVIVYQSSKVEPSNSVTLPGVPGVYIGHIRTVSGNDYQFKVIVTQ